MRFAKVCLLVVFAVSARADSFADLKAAVGGLRGAAPIRATIEMQRVDLDKGKKPPETISGSAVVDALVDGEGLHVAYAPALLAKVAKEQAERQANPDLHAPTARAVTELGPLAIAERLDFGRQVAAMLSRAELLSEKRVVYEGRPARLLALKIKNAPVKTSIGHVEILEDSLNVWIGDDNVPLAAQRTERYTGGILFLKMEIKQANRWTFMRKDDRLVATRSEAKNAQSGFGQNNEETEIVTVAIR
jgi:hypothetical protein